MTADHPVRRVLARLCSAETMARVVDPTLADMRVENGRSAWLGYVSLARALTLHAVLSPPGAVARAWSDDERALPRAAAACALTIIVLAAPLIAPAAHGVLRISFVALVLLVPQAVALALPTSLLIAVPLAFRRVSNARHILVRGLALSAICAAATLIVMIQLLPDANQAYRVEIMKRIDPSVVHLPRGPMEMTLHELRERIDVLRLTPGGVVAARQFEYTFQMKLAMSAIALPVGLLAIAVTIVARGRVRSIALGIGVAFVYVYGVFAADTWALQWLRRSDAVSPAVLAWAPATLIATLALAILWKSRIRLASPCS
jgi:hypothetical protein